LEDNNEITAALYELFSNAEKMYGDALENYWFYESEICPCCNKNKIDPLAMGHELALSLNGYMYRDLNTLIAYLLCSRCIVELLRKDKRSKVLYKKIEAALKKEYSEHLKSKSS
jgi:hypothetical protein